MTKKLVLDGASLTLEALALAARDPTIPIECQPKALARVAAGWKRTVAFVEAYTKDPNDPAKRVYGVTTGFGEFKDRYVPPEKLVELQRNLLKSHAVGVGETSDPSDPRNDYPLEVVRAVILLRLNTFLRGHSGVSPELVECLRAWLRRGVVARVPIRGSVGSSGDLCPLAHLFVVLLGEGDFAIADTKETIATYPRAWKPARALPGDCRYAIRWKEGLALSNGATFSAAILALAAHDAGLAADAADLAAALTLEAMCGNTRAFDPKIHAARGMRGQRDSAARILQLVRGSKLVDRTAAVQDPYSLRCAPQVHGASRDAIDYAKGIARAEINAVTDNPLFFAVEDGHDAPADVKHFRGNWPAPKDERAYSQGNFHGQPVALAADFLGIALAELASISERRCQLLLDKHHNRGLPANLTIRRGVQSGLMIAQYSAASLVSENKVLAHPASVDSIPTGANSEDHNSMATIAARKLRTILGNAQSVLALELMCAAQAIDWRAGMDVDPNETRGDAMGDWAAAEAEAAAFTKEMAGPATRRAAKLGKGTRAGYLAIRAAVPAVVDDRVLAGDAARLRFLVSGGGLVDSFVKPGAPSQWTR